MGNVQSQYLILLDAYPVPTKTVTSSVIMTAGAFLARFVNPGPLSQVAVFAVWGFLLGPLSHVWNNVIATYGPSSLVARRVLVCLCSCSVRGRRLFALFPTVSRGYLPRNCTCRNIW